MITNIIFNHMDFYKGKKIMFKNPVFIDHVGKFVQVDGHRSGWLIDYKKKEGESVVMIILNAASYFVELKNIKSFTGWMD